ncbi:6-phosphofructokinase [Sediminibacillus albus]|uniref:6-phosphofructokinase 1 n=1 Tax=Sediminibacillus albus TaxID=407036 RepID=A0A1G8Y9U2_9BACI|nr:6-phosphofructokinase [Sediminibacillus albus]SDJ99659.1 6-phosphofructokinase 1 [Sediminibacillus albus]
MKIAIINFELAPAGVNQLLHKVVAELLENHTVTGVRMDQNDSGPSFVNFKKENFASTPFHFKNMLQLSLLQSEIDAYQSLTEFDAVIVVGPEQALQWIQAQETKGSGTKFLMVPVSIYNSIEGTDQSLGYDTAINYMIESILKIRDTIDSLKYPNPRLVGVQLEGAAPEHMLDELALAVKGHPLHHDAPSQDIDHLKTALRQEFSSGLTHSFLIFDGRMEAESIPDSLLADIPMNWKTHPIDEALCMGPEPTAQDRIIAMKLARDIISWIDGNGPTGKLTINNRQTAFQII